MSPSKQVWLAARRWLASYSARDPHIRHCYLRHSASAAWQNALLSDFDVAFFVDARDTAELYSRARGILADMKRTRLVDPIVLPATASTYQRCATHYLFRSLYPMTGWNCLYGEPWAVPQPAPEPLPLDHVPENFLSHYLLQVVRGKRRPRLLHRPFLHRKLQLDRQFVLGGSFGQPAPGTTFGALAEEVRLWDRFYGRIDTSAAALDTRPVTAAPNTIAETLAERWRLAAPGAPSLRGLASLWVYPAFHRDDSVRLAVNFHASATGDQCRQVVRTIGKTFGGLRYELLAGTERAMLGRLYGLSRQSLIEPWLARASAVCVYGDESLRNRIPMPAPDMLDHKLREFLLYLAYGVLSRYQAPNYAFYRLAFTMDHLFRRSEIVTATGRLADLYRGNFLSEEQYLASVPAGRLVEAWTAMHGFDLVSAGAVT